MSFRAESTVGSHPEWTQETAAAFSGAPLEKSPVRKRKRSSGRRGSRRDARSFEPLSEAARFVSPLSKTTDIVRTFADRKPDPKNACRFS